MTVKLGMCGFTIGRATYYRQFPVVEVQQTFYDPPPLETLSRWRSEAPAAFEFTMKAWQVITHFGTSRTYRRLRSPFSDKKRDEAGGFRTNATVLDAWRRTVDCCATLRATAILFQCPASFRATTENIAAMRDFFTTIERPSNVRLMWEPRGAWPDDVVLALCKELDLIHAVDPFVRPSLTPRPRYWRLHGNKSHYASFDDAELHQIRTWIHDMPDTETYVLFNNIPRVADIKRARALGLFDG
jgi:uncharacterized protein YecE (DUF72 family)